MVAVARFAFICSKWHVVLTAFLAATLPARSAEIDSFTLRNGALSNSFDGVERRINGFIRSGVEKANEVSEGCDEDELYLQIRRAIAFPFIGHSVAEELSRAEDVDTRWIPFQDSIYRDLDVFDAISVHLKDLGAVMRLNEHLVGVDKIGHFLAQGWRYFEIAYLEGKGIEAAMRWGEGTEERLYGFYTTGVYSQADLTVNFEGMRFWLRILGQLRDPIEDGYFANRSYVTCRRRAFFGARRWRVRREVELEDYLTRAWDEGVNCSRYRNAEIAELVQRRIDERAVIEGENYTCPIEPDACVAARKRYDRYADRLLHATCFAAEPERRPRPWWMFW